jgi:hypothetical protein
MSALSTLVGLLTLGSGLGLGLGAVGVATLGSVAKAGADTPATENDSSYAIVDATGGVLTFGGAGYSGDTLDTTLNKPIVGAAPDPTGGYWLVASDGGIFAFGGAQFYGSTGAITLNKPIVAMAPTPDGKGYWLVASDGGVFCFGDAQFYGSTGAITLNKPIVGMAPTGSGQGYWLVASDGGIFAFGDAPFYGSTGALTLNKPVVGMAASSGGLGYWLVASDGGIFAFGNAPFYGSTGGLSLNAPIVGMSSTPDGGGYWMVGADAGVFTFGDAAYAGSAESPLHPPLFPAGFSYNIAPAVTIMPDVAGPQAAHQGRLRVAFTGDSLGFYEGEYALGTNPPYFIDNGAAPGCGFTNGGNLLPWSNTSAVYTSPIACTLWAQQVQWLTARFHPDVTVIQLGYWESQYRQFNGTYQTLTDPAYAQYIQDNLQQAVTLAHSRGGAVILNTSPYFDDGTPNSLVDSFNQIVKNVVAANSNFVTLFDVNTLLDPGGMYSAVVDGVLVRTDDGVHITEDGTEQVVVPPMNQLINQQGGPIYQGNE